MEYILELKQIVDYPRVRIHRELIQKLLGDESLSIRGNCYLFHFMVLCSYANFRSSRKRIDGQTHLIGPGQWICDLHEIRNWFRLERLKDVKDILNYLKERKFISFEFLSNSKKVHYRILNWSRFNASFEYECRCPKDSGFFFFPIAYAERLIKNKRCSDLDALMDLWLNTIYMDDRVQGSDLGPVVYYRNLSGDPRTSYKRLAVRWGIGKATVSRLLNRLEASGYLTCLTFSGSQGTVLYLSNYLSTMFNICDVPVDKDEVAFTLKLRTKVKQSASTTKPTHSKNPVSISPNAVPKEAVRILVSKVLETLTLQGFTCCGCGKKAAKLYPLSNASGGWILEIACRKPERPAQKFRFVVRVIQSDGG